jgi:AcrR family transcriptional regulator
VVAAETTSAAIAAAALAEFIAFGYRRTSVESIAHRAEMSRATIYKHWSGKDELFRALAARLHDEQLAAMHAVADNASLDIETRLVRLLQARFGRLVKLTAASANATELYDSHGRLCGDIAQDAERRAERLITAVLRRAVAAGELDLTRCRLTVAPLAGVLGDCAHGAKGENPAAVTPSDFAVRLTHDVRAIICGIGKQAAQ